MVYMEVNMTNEEQIGFHKGALATLAKEREEFFKILQVVESLMQAHMKALKDLGVDLEKEMKKAKEQLEKQSKKSIDEKLDLD